MTVSDAAIAAAIGLVLFLALWWVSSILTGIRREARERNSEAWRESLRSMTDEEFKRFIWQVDRWEP